MSPDQPSDRAVAALLAVTGAPPFAGAPGETPLDEVAAAGLAHCRRLLSGVAALPPEAREAAAPAARAVFETAVPLVWALEDPALRGPRYLMERDRAAAKLRDAAGRQGLLAAPPDANRAARPRTRSEVLPPFDRMARALGLGREDVVLRRAAEAAARGAFDGPPLADDPVRIVATVFARLAIAVARVRAADEEAAAAEHLVSALAAGDPAAVAEVLAREAEPAPQTQSGPERERPPAGPEIAAPELAAPEPAVPESVAPARVEDHAASARAPEEPDAEPAPEPEPEREPAAAAEEAPPRRRRSSVDYVIVDGEQPRVLRADDAPARRAPVPGTPDPEEDTDGLTDFLDTF